MSLLGERIREQRELMGYSQEELAKMLGYKSRSTINKIEMGVNDITQSRIIDFAKILHVSPSYLMGWEDEAPIRLSKEEEKLLDNYRGLNSCGKDRLLEYSDDLVCSGKY